MENTLLVVAVLVVGGCAATPSKTNHAPATVPFSTAEELLTYEDSVEAQVAGTYELKKDGDTLRGALLENGIAEAYENGKKRHEGKWSISNDGELHIVDEDDNTEIYIFNPDGSITGPIAGIDKDGKRKDYAKEVQDTLKKIK